MSKTVEDFDLSYADNKNSKNSSNIFPKNSRSKNVSNRKRTRENEIIPDDGGQHKRVKNSNTSNLEEAKENYPHVNDSNPKRNQQLIKEYNNMKQIYEEERVNQQSHLYLRRMSHDKAEQFPEL
jgi:hypothetical protein